MSFQITCTFEKAYPVVSGTKKDGSGQWKNRQILCKYKDGQYEKQIAFKVFNDQLVDYVGKITKGSELDVSFSAESREYNDKPFTDLSAFKIMNHSQDVNHDAQQPDNSNQGSSQQDDEGDLPF